MLAPFTKWMERYCDVRSFIWKAEAQKNGNIHFHITTNKFIHWRSVRAKWNKILAKHNYCKVYQDGTNDKGNAATQIKAVRNEKEIGYYMMKYMMKNEKDKRKINGRVWAASHNLNESALVLNELSPMYELTDRWLNKDYVTDKKVMDGFTMYFYKGKVLKWLPPNVREEFTSQIQKMKDDDGHQSKIYISSLN